MSEHDRHWTANQAQLRLLYDDLVRKGLLPAHAPMPQERKASEGCPGGAGSSLFAKVLKEPTD